MIRPASDIEARRGNHLERFYKHIISEESCFFYRCNLFSLNTRSGQEKSEISAVRGTLPDGSENKDGSYALILHAYLEWSLYTR